MKTEMIIGTVIVVCAVGVITSIVLWSRRTIQRIADKGLGSAREILKDLNDDR